MFEAGVDLARMRPAALSVSPRYMTSTMSRWLHVRVGSSVPAALGTKRWVTVSLWHPSLIEPMIVSVLTGAGVGAADAAVLGLDPPPPPAATATPTAAAPPRPIR